tara:strand:+ start:199 stop:408 length:210 start_codon:yes stop_codon:yes gene_type:complete
MRTLVATLTALMLFAATPVVMGCAMKPEEISRKSSAYLCRQYYSLLAPNYKDPNILDELLKRGIGACPD